MIKLKLILIKNNTREPPDVSNRLRGLKDKQIGQRDIVSTFALKLVVLNNVLFWRGGRMPFNSPDFPPQLVLAAIQQKATLCLSDLEERLSDSAELGNRHLAGEPM